MVTYEWEVQGHYGKQYGWECVSTYNTRDEAIVGLGEYDANESYPHRIKRYSVKED